MTNHQGRREGFAGHRLQHPASVHRGGLLRQVIVDAARSYFDTNTGDHQHFFLEKEGC
jgi:hypothetical protein